ncbi:MAG: GyrI-like domain-containing protein, partial [Actinomycetota bacterium]
MVARAFRTILLVFVALTPIPVAIAVTRGGDAPVRSGPSAAGTPVASTPTTAPAPACTPDPSLTAPAGRWSSTSHATTRSAALPAGRTG